MNKIEAVERILEFLDRTPIVGAEAADMVICKQWLQNTKRSLEVADSVTPVPQVAGTGGK